jgi:hypothetical protein
MLVLLLQRLLLDGRRSGIDYFLLVVVSRGSAVE